MKSGMIMMMKFKDWNYKEMGFNSETEMKDSIARVERRSKMNDVEFEIERRKEAQITGFDFSVLNEGARLEGLDRVVRGRLMHEREQAKRQAEQKSMQSLLNATANNVTAKKEAKAQREMQNAKEKLEDDLQKEIYSKHGVKTDKELELDAAYRNLLG